jgi:nicotinate phosphoribosyltransferase
MREPSASPLLTDLYQLTMLQAYWQHQMAGDAVFELFVRTLPRDRAFLVAAGLEQMLDFIEQARFDAAELEWVERCGTFAPGFADWLAQLRFTGDVGDAEGTVCLPTSPCCAWWRRSRRRSGSRRASSI